MSDVTDDAPPSIRKVAFAASSGAFTISRDLPSAAT